MNHYAHGALVAAKAERCFGGFAAQGILDEFATAFGAKIESQLLVDIVADLIVVGVIKTFQNILYLFEMIAIVVGVIGGCRIKRGVDLDFDDVTEIVLGIKFPLAQVT